MNQQFRKDTAGTLKTTIYENNHPVSLSSATITIYKPSSDEKLIDNAAMIVGSNGLILYNLTAANNAALGENYKADIDYILTSGTTGHIYLYYDVVRSMLVQVITDADLYNELPQLKNLGYKIHGVADSGTATTIVDAELKRYEDDYFTGGLAYSVKQDETREITDFVSSTGTITVANAFSAAVTTDRYVLTQSFTTQIRRAFEKLKQKLKSGGKKPQLILDAYDLREAHILYSVAEVCKGQIAAEGEGNLWWDLWKDYEKQAENVFNEINLKYDISGDGMISSDESVRRTKFYIKYPTLR